MTKQPLELRLSHGRHEDLEITGTRIWALRLLLGLLILYLSYALSKFPDTIVELVFLSFVCLFFGGGLYWGLLYIFADPEGYDRHERYKNEPFASIDCPECSSTVEAANLDCPECGSELRK